MFSIIIEYTFIQKDIKTVKADQCGLVDSLKNATKEKI